MPARHPSESPSPYSVLIATIFAVLLLLFVYSVADVLLMVFVAALFSLYLGAIADFLQARANMPRGLGLACAMLLTVLLAAGVGWLVIPPVLKQTQELVAALPREITGWTEGLRTMVGRYPILQSVIHPDEVQRQLSGMMANASKLVPAVLNFMHGFIDLSGILVMGIYLASRPEMYREGIIALSPPVHRELVRDILADLKRSLRAWIGGQMMAMFFLGVLTFAGLSILKVPFALAFGVFTGVAVLVPFFGSLLSTLLPAILVVGQGGIVQALGVVVLGVVIHVIEGNIIHPIVMERRVHLPPVLSITSVLVMGELLGFIGLLVAVPVLATTMVIVRRIYIHRLLEGKGFRRFVRDAPTEIRLPDGVQRVDPALVSIPAILEEAGAAPR
ncbi:AI-2E family transporter [Longimicrobium sp.]|uniref:AI-2E family transporter n=1 Tax=Longimicrobium sp. TaxID=2029185 RepID=UPI002D0A222A|nr:AI-2E family transporter [Longimicrobium sp.]HSU17449.1 AI-2E family transporter [Longimicrobium sp.]